MVTSQTHMRKHCDKDHKMKNTINWIVVLLLFNLIACETKEPTTPDGGDLGALVINEFLASNDSTNLDEFDESDDWVELYNGTSDIMDVGGMYITDDPLDLNPWMIPETDPSETSIPPKGFLLLWCDKDPEQGVRHVDIKLSARGEHIILLGKDMATIIDSIQFGTMTTDISYGRETDGGDLWTLFATPTPGATN